jgi:phosphopantothenate synthetase
MKKTTKQKVINIVRAFKRIAELEQKQIKNSENEEIKKAIEDCEEILKELEK